MGAFSTGYHAPRVRGCDGFNANAFYPGNAFLSSVCSLIPTSVCWLAGCSLLGRFSDSQPQPRVLHPFADASEQYDVFDVIAIVGFLARSSNENSQETPKLLTQEYLATIQLDSLDTWVHALGERPVLIIGKPIAVVGCCLIGFCARAVRSYWRRVPHRPRPSSDAYGGDLLFLSSLLGGTPALARAYRTDHLPSQAWGFESHV